MPFHEVLKAIKLLNEGEEEGILHKQLSHLASSLKKEILSHIFVEERETLPALTPEDIRLHFDEPNTQLSLNLSDPLPQPKTNKGTSHLAEPRIDRSALGTHTARTHNTQHTRTRTRTHTYTHTTHTPHYTSHTHTHTHTL